MGGDAMSAVTVTYDADEMGDDLPQPTEPSASPISSPLVRNYLESAWWATAGWYASGQMTITFRRGEATDVDVHVRMNER